MSSPSTSTSSISIPSIQQQQQPPSSSPTKPTKKPTPTNSRQCNFKLQDLKFLLGAEFLFGWIVLLLTILVSVLLVVFRKELLPPVVAFTDKIRSLGAFGYLAVGALEFVASFPPMFGFGTLQLLSGFIYGMMGVVPMVVGGYLGGLASFLVIRYWAGNYYRRVFREKYPKFRAIEEAIEEGGLKLIVLLRLAPYPYAVMNGLLATTSTSFRNYALATLVAMLKAPLNVYIGTTLQNIADLISGRGGAPAPVEMGIMITGFVVAFVGLVYFSWLIRRMLKRYEEREEVVVETSRVERGESEGTLEEGEEESVGDEEKVVDVVTVK